MHDLALFVVLGSLWMIILATVELFVSIIHPIYPTSVWDYAHYHNRDYLLPEDFRKILAVHKDNANASLEFVNAVLTKQVTELRICAFIISNSGVLRAVDGLEQWRV